MRLTDRQRTSLAEEGFLSLPSLFTAKEVELMRNAADALVAARGEHVIAEEDSDVIKMVFGAHLEHDLFARLARHPCLLHPVEQSLGEPVHVFQSRLNVKTAFAGGGWPWHQDFNQWYRQDGMRTPRATIVGVFLDDVNPCNGPLMMIPRSHRDGHILVPDGMDIPFDLVTRAANEHGIVPMMGPPGTAILFDSLTIHASAPNVSPWPRRIFYFNYAAASCCDLQPLRPRHLCDPEAVPLTALTDDCLVGWRATA
ncbi:MAG TPA: phytanoyl-CoA dioxygenase family protein [Thermoanaerobaculia bacterium]|nr:phytanoyl-CoA dioxygenase family protein [Thermoanaerobaculia bacterium]